jgi:hypothetical protein
MLVDKPKLEIQVDSIINNNIENREEVKRDKEFKFKTTTVNTNESDEHQLMGEQKGKIATEFNNRLKLSFDLKKYPPQPNTYSSP